MPTKKRLFEVAFYAFISVAILTAILSAFVSIVQPRTVELVAQVTQTYDASAAAAAGYEPTGGDINLTLTEDGLQSLLSSGDPRATLCLDGGIALGLMLVNDPMPCEGQVIQAVLIRSR